MRILRPPARIFSFNVHDRDAWVARNAALIGWSHWMSCFYALEGAPGDWLRRRGLA